VLASVVGDNGPVDGCGLVGHSQSSCSPAQLLPSAPANDRWNRSLVTRQQTHIVQVRLRVDGVLAFAVPPERVRELGPIGPLRGSLSDGV